MSELQNRLDRISDVNRDSRHSPVFNDRKMGPFQSNFRDEFRNDHWHDQTHSGVRRHTSERRILPQQPKQEPYSMDCRKNYRL